MNPPHLWADRVATFLQGAVIPALDGGDAEADRVARDGVTPLAGGECLELGAQRAFGRRCRQQLSNHGEAQFAAFVDILKTQGRLSDGQAELHLGAIVDHLRASKMNTAADLVEQSVHETLTYYAFPDIHWQKIRTNNPLERIMKEIRRRTRVVGAFPDGQSCLNLAAARLRYIAGTAWSAKCYMNIRPLYQQLAQAGAAVA